MPERKVTREIADIIYKSYEAMVIIPRKLKLDRYKHKEALKIIRSDIREEFDVTIAVETIKEYSYHTFDELVKRKRNYIEKRRIKEGGVANSDYYEFLDSMKGFENEEVTLSINPTNSYVKVLLTLSNYDYPVKGKKLAKDIGVVGVREELKALKKHGLIERPVQIKFIISRKGRKYLKKGGILD